MKGKNKKKYFGTIKWLLKSVEKKLMRCFE